MALRLPVQPPWRRLDQARELGGRTSLLVDRPWIGPCVLLVSLRWGQLPDDKGVDVGHRPHSNLPRSAPLVRRRVVVPWSTTRAVALRTAPTLAPWRDGAAPRRC